MNRPSAGLDRLYQNVLELFGFLPKTRPKALLVLKIHSSHCPDSQTIDPKFSSLKDRFEGDRVLFLKLDFSDTATTHQAWLMASALRVKSLIRKNQQTGQILLVDGRNRVILDRFDRYVLFSEMARTINKHLQKI